MNVHQVTELRCVETRYSTPIDASSPDAPPAPPIRPGFLRKSVDAKLVEDLVTGLWTAQVTALDVERPMLLASA